MDYRKWFNDKIGYLALGLAVGVGLHSLYLGSHISKANGQWRYSYESDTQKQNGHSLNQIPDLTAEADRPESARQPTDRWMSLIQRQMSEMENLNRELFASQNLLDDDPRDQIAISNGGPRVEIEDAKDHVTYHIKVRDAGSQNVKVTAKNGVLEIQDEAQAQDQKHGFSSAQRFEEAFSLAPNLDAAQMKTVTKKDEITVLIPKKIDAHVQQSAEI
jgi:HSP20 family molecular chaperone IbpA